LASVMKAVLIANRAEVTVRVIWACRELRLRAVEVYSEADWTVPHVLLTDEAYLIGSASSANSYVQIDRILAVAVKRLKDVIPPGYGFLAECVPPVEAVFECRKVQSSTWLSRVQDPDGVSTSRTTLPSWWDRP